MPIVFLTTLAFIALSEHLRHTYALSRLAVSCPLLLVAALLYIVARTLHMRLLRRTAERVAHGTPARARLGDAPGVPHWVQALANVAFGIALAALIPLAEELAR